MLPAFYNGYPLVYSDTGAYIGSGMDLNIPYDRPIMYGLFIRLFSFGSSLWLVIFFQSLIVSYVLWQISKLIYKHISYSTFLIALAVLVSITGLGWYTGKLMPDIYSAVAVLCIPLLLFHKEYSLLRKITFILITILSIEVHFSNFVIVLIVLLLAFIIHKKNLSHSYKKPVTFLLASILLVLSIGIASVLNYSIGRTFKINQGSHVFLTGRMLDNGILRSFLDDQCITNNEYILCPCKDSLPVDSRAFLWGEKSPLYHNGGWEKTSEPYNKILTGILTSPKHLCMFVFYSAIESITQLCQNDIGSGLIGDWYGAPASGPYQQIEKNFKSELNQYRQSRQNINLWGDGLNFDLINKLNHVIMIGCSLILFVIGLKKYAHFIDPKARFIGIILITGVIANAMVTGALANAYDRLQARVSWIIIYLVILFFLVNRHLILNKIKGFLQSSPKR